MYRSNTISKQLGYRLSPQTSSLKLRLTLCSGLKGGFSGSVCSASWSKWYKWYNLKYKKSATVTDPPKAPFQRTGAKREDWGDFQPVCHRLTFRFHRLISSFHRAIKRDRRIKRRDPLQKLIGFQIMPRI
jgi:hypothetical protein